MEGPAPQPGSGAIGAQLAPSLMEQALGPEWQRLPPTLQAHHRGGATIEHGHLDVHYPPVLQPLLWLLGRIGALVHRRGRAVPIRVQKDTAGGVQHWRRVLRYPDGQRLRFDSVWEPGPPGHLVEFVNPFLGLELAPSVVGPCLHYRGVCFVARLGRWTLRFPQWLGPGATCIVERAVDAQHIAMDFRMTHPWLGELYRYGGVFRVDPGEA